MSRILFFGDTHISERHSMGGASIEQPSLSLREAGRAFDRVIAHAKDVDVVVHLGDVFDRAQPTPAEYALAIEVFRDLKSQCAQTIIIEGNHDRTARHQALSVLDSAVEISIITESCSFNVGEFESEATLCCVPYPPPTVAPHEREQWLEDALHSFLDDRENYEAIGGCRCWPTILVTHATFAGARFNATQTVPTGEPAIALSWLDEFDHAFSGHIHLRQQLGGNGHYVGTPYRWNHGDQGPCGFCILDTETGEIEWHDDDDAIKFVTVEAADLLTMAPDELTDMLPAGRLAVRVNGEVPAPSILDATHDLVDNLVTTIGERGVGWRKNLRVARQTGALKLNSTLHDDEVAQVFNAYTDARPDAIPADEHPEVLTATRTALEEGGAS